MNHQIDFAVIKMGDKQHRVVKGEAFECEKIDLPINSEYTIQDIVFIKKGNEILVEDEAKHYKVNCKIIKQFRDDKVIVFKKKRRKGYTRKKGHRQYRTILNVESIEQK